jgi:hypothetical protein
MLDWPSLHIALRVTTLCGLSVAPILAEEPAIYPLTESSIVDMLNDSAADVEYQRFLRHAIDSWSTVCTVTPFPDVVYPKLLSPAPLYGRLPLARRSEGVLHFVLDQSQPTREPAVKEDHLLLRRLVETLTGRQESPPSVAKYDVLYVDLNGDQDLRNDPPLQPMKAPPDIFGTTGPTRCVVVFDTIDIKAVGTPSSTSKPVPVLPWYSAVVNQQATFSLVTAAVRTGRIQIGNTWYQIVMNTMSTRAGRSLMARPEPAAGTESGKMLWRLMALGFQQLNGAPVDRQCPRENLSEVSSYVVFLHACAAPKEPTVRRCSYGDGHARSQCVAGPGLLRSGHGSARRSDSEGGADYFRVEFHCVATVGSTGVRRTCSRRLSLLWHHAAVCLVDSYVVLWLFCRRRRREDMAWSGRLRVFRHDHHTALGRAGDRSVCDWHATGKTPRMHGATTSQDSRYAGTVASSDRLRGHHSCWSQACRRGFHGSGDSPCGKSGSLAWAKNAAVE